MPVILHSVSNEHAIPTEKYFIPATWRRFQLSQLINNVLATSKAIPFDFFIGEDSSGGKLTTALETHTNGVRWSVSSLVQIYSQQRTGRDATLDVRTVDTAAEALEYV